MNTVKIETKKLLAKVKENRIAHETEYNAAMVEYRKACIAKMRENLTKAESGGEITNSLDLAKPRSSVDEYDKIISMLEWTTDKEVELDMHQFAQYVNDEWSWQHSFKSVNSAYLAVK